MEMKLAFDKASVRKMDANGRLHISVSNISKATVNPYLGSEIPGFEALGLDPKKVFMLFRPPEELAKAAPTFNNVQLLDLHVPVSADDPQKGRVVGSTGTDAKFSAPYLQNSLVIWDAVAIQGIESREQCELSCGYSYEVDMTPGAYEGQKYDGKMKNIIGNHVALVDIGRAGPDVVVGDALPKVIKLQAKDKGAIMAKRKTTPKPLHALDRDAFSSRLSELLKPRLAADADLDDLTDLLDQLEEKEDGEEECEDDGEEAMDALKTMMDGLDLPADTKLQVDGLFEKMKVAKSKPKARDTFPPIKKEPKVDPKKDEPKGMDAASVATLVQDAENKAVARVQAIHVALEEVRPHVGTIAAMDSAEAVYKFALDAAEVDIKEVPSSAFRAMVKMLPRKSETPMLAMDAAGSKSYEDTYHASRIRRA